MGILGQKMAKLNSAWLEQIQKILLNQQVIIDQSLSKIHACTLKREKAREKGVEPKNYFTIQLFCVKVGYLKRLNHLWYRKSRDTSANF